MNTNRLGQIFSNHQQQQPPNQNVNTGNSGSPPSMQNQNPQQYPFPNVPTGGGGSPPLMPPTASGIWNQQQMANIGILGPNQTLGIIGGGNMGQSIAFPLFEKGIINPQSVIVSATSDNTLEVWRKFGCRVTLRNESVLQHSNIVIWAVKPQVFPGVIENLSNLKPVMKDGVLHISIMAGMSLDRFTDKLRRGLYYQHQQPQQQQNSKSPQQDQGRGGSPTPSQNFRTIRVMPNIGMQVGSGVAVFASSPTTLDSDRHLMFALFQPIGLCYEVQESQMNAYCGLFGSGIGFMFPVLEALSDGAVKVGIPRAISLEIAAQVMVGAGQLYLQNKTHPGVLKDQVCSPGGTTIAGIAELERGGIRSIIMSAIEAATTRGDELGAAPAHSQTQQRQ